jgi:phage portal protein BeeE
MFFSPQQMIAIRQAATLEMANNLGFSPDFLGDNQRIKSALTEQSELHHGGLNHIIAPTPEMMQKWYDKELTQDSQIKIYDQYIKALWGQNFPLPNSSQYPKPDATVQQF